MGKINTDRSGDQLKMSTIGGKSLAVQEKVFIVFDAISAKTKSIITVKILSESVVTKSLNSNQVSLKI